MSLLVTLKTTELDEGIPGRIPQEAVLSGQALTKSWEQDNVSGKVRSGVWEIEPSTVISRKGETWEFCQILQGACVITPEGGAPVHYKAGDSFILKPGFVGTWEVTERLRKIYVIVS